MSQNNKNFIAGQWGGSFGNYQSGYQNPIKTEASSTAAPLRMDGSSSNRDVMSDLIGIIGGGITTSLSDLKSGIGEIKDQNTTNSKEIKDKIDNIYKNNWLDSLLNPATLAVIGIVILLVICFIAAILKKYTDIGFSDLRDYIFLFGGGLVGLIGGDKMKKNSN